MWVPYSEVRPLAAFEEYVRQHPELGRFGIFPDESEKPMAAQRPRTRPTLPTSPPPREDDWLENELAGATPENSFWEGGVMGQRPP